MERIMDQYIRSEKERLLARKADALAVRFAERAERHDREGSFPFDNFADMREAGILRLTVPERFGGDEISLYELVMVQERLAYGDGSTALAVGWHLGQMLHLRSTGKWPEAMFCTLCRDVVRDGAMINTFASEAASGSPSRGGKPETSAVRTEEGWRINGRKTFSTLSPILDRFVVSAYIEDEGRSSDFLVRKGEGVAVEETWDVLGMRATGSHDVVLADVFVPADARIAANAHAVDDGGGWLLHIPACYLGLAMAARDFAVHFALTYRPNSLPGPIAELPAVQHSIGLMEIELRTARALLYSTADRWDGEAAARPALKPELGLAKYVAVNNAIRVTDMAMRVVGGASLSKKLPLERYYRDVRAGLHNPPMDDAVIRMLASGALSEPAQ